MLSNHPGQRVTFGAFTLDVTSGELRKNGTKLKLGEQPFQILSLLLERRGELVLREELHKRLWPSDTFVDFDHGLNSAMRRLRDVLGDGQEKPQWVETVPRRGYRFIGEVQSGTNRAGIATKPAEPQEVAEVAHREAGRTESKVSKWGALANTFVTEDVLTRCVSELRKAFGDDAKNPQVIATVPRGGYRLLAVVEGTETKPPEIASLPRKMPGWRVAAVVAAGLVALSLVSVVAFSSRGWRDHLLGHRSPSLPIRSLSVLPLENLSHDPEQDYFADGMTEELTTDLAKISTLRVISRTSAVHYKGTTETIPQIARELGVDAAVIGSVQRVGNRVRITVQLIEARSDSHLWAQSYERDLRDILSLQSEVAGTIAEQISIQLTPQERASLTAPRPISPEAYEAYLEGRYFWNQLTKEGIKKSVEYYHKAIELAPDYAPAYAGLAFAHNLLASSEYEAPRENYAKAKQFALLALEKDSALSEAHAALGFVLFYSEWNWNAAEGEFKRAIELNPKDGTARHVHALSLGALGRSEEAISEIRKDLEVNPLSVLTRWNLGWLYWISGQFDRANEQFHKILEIDPDSPDGHEGLGMVYTSRKQYAEAIAELQRAVKLSNGNAVYKLGLGYSYALAGNRRAALQILNDLNQRSQQEYISAYLVATVHAGLGDSDSAFRWLEKAIAERNDLLVELKVEPAFAPCRSDPRFADLVHRIGLPE